MKDPVEASGEEAPQYAIPALSEGVKRQQWVTLVKCGSILDADMIATQLRASGIEVFIPDEYLMTNAAWGLNAYGYIRVQVQPREYEGARELLCANGVASCG